MSVHLNNNPFRKISSLHLDIQTRNRLLVGTLVTGIICAIGIILATSVLGKLGIIYMAVQYTGTSLAIAGAVTASTCGITAIKIHHCNLDRLQVRGFQDDF